jgi:ribosome-associated translation inhibitor RaiA
MIELGGNIELVGFKDLDSAELIILKKIIGNYARKFSDGIKGYERLSINLKKIGGQKSSKYEFDGKLMINGKLVNSSTTENNLFMGVAEVLKKLESQTLK